MITALVAFLAMRPYDCVRSAPFHPEIHSLGNVGLGGRVHACLAWPFTRIIDVVAYGSRNVRAEVASKMRKETDAKYVLELGCGTGTATHELVKNGFVVDAVDTSNHMIEQARKRVCRGATFSVGNAVDATCFETEVVIACMLFHELPKTAHVAILEAMLPAKVLWIVDISKTYSPSPVMLSGEPYLAHFLESFDDTIRDFSRRHDVSLETEELVKDHVTLWKLS